MNGKRYLANIFPCVALLLLAGCSGGGEPTAGKDIAAIKTALRGANSVGNPATKIELLTSAYDNFQALETRWPDSEAVASFREKQAKQMDAIPRQIHDLAMQTRDLDAFKWALARSVPLSTQYSDLLKYWEKGRPWREFILSKDPQALPVFMALTIQQNRTGFFYRHAEEFRKTGYKLVFPLEKTQFNAHYCQFAAKEMAEAMKTNGTERIRFLIDNMMPRSSVGFLDAETAQTLRALGPYVCEQLKDEQLACKLLDLGYDMDRVDLSKTGFKPGGPFFQALEARPEYALVHVLGLDEWKGSLSPQEAALLQTFPDAALRKLNDLHLDELIKFAVKRAELENAVRLLRLREERSPLSPYEFKQLLGQALESGDTAVFNYVRQHGKVDIFSMQLDQLASSPELFMRYGPKILAKIYPTMDKEPKKDGTTYGRIQDLLNSHHPRVVLYVVRNYDIGAQWKVVTGGRTLLMEVCEGGNLEAARYLVEQRGEDVHAHTGYVEFQSTIFGHNRGAKEGKLTPMFFAAQGDTDGSLIRYLASKGGGVNARSNFGATPLMYAVDSDNLAAAKALIELGANVNARMHENLTARELSGLGRYKDILTPYRRALKKGNPAMLDLLKKAGAQP